MQQPLSIAMLLLPAFNSLAANAFLDPFRAANYLQDRRHYDWHFLSLEGGEVAASNGWVTAATRPYYECKQPFDFLVVNASWTPEAFQDKRLRRWLRQCAQQNTVLAGIDTGAFVLAYAGLMNGYKTVVHYEHADSFRELFPLIPLETGLFVIDRQRMSSCGGLAAADLATEIVQRQQGIALANAVAHYIFQDRLRSGQETQYSRAHEPVGYALPEALREAIILMERNIEEPLRLAEIAHYAGLSLRQLERMFNKHVHMTPVRYYLNARLEQARRLVTQTELSLVEIATACGFKHAEQLSRRYKLRFGMPPSKHRIAGRVPFQFR